MNGPLSIADYMREVLTNPSVVSLFVWLEKASIRNDMSSNSNNLLDNYYYVNCKFSSGMICCGKY